MKNGWQTKALGDVCRFIDYRGKTPKKTESGLRLITAKNVKMGFLQTTPLEFVNPNTYKSWMTRGIPKRGDVLFTTEAPLANVAQLDTDEKVVFAQRIIVLQPSENNLNRTFLKYLLLSDLAQQRIHEMGTGATVKRIKASLLKTIPIEFPPLPEQQRIVGILDEAFEGIATAKVNAERNLQNARALFQSHLQSVFTQRGKGWVEKKLGDESLLEIIDGDRGVNYPKASDFCDEGHCLFLNTKNVRPNGFDFESTMFITAEKDGQLRKGKLKRDDVVLTTRGTIGNIGIYADDVPFDNIRINSGMLILRPNKRALLPSFLFELLRSEIVKEQIRTETTGAAQPQLPIKTLVNFKIPVPMNLEDQLALVTQLRAFEPGTQRLESIYQRKLAALEALKKSLLHQAFSGQL